MLAVANAIENYLENDVAEGLFKKAITLNAVQSPKAAKGSSKIIDLNNYINYVTNVSKLKPTLDRVNLSNMMITHNFLHRTDSSVPNDDDA